MGFTIFGNGCLVRRKILNSFSLVSTGYKILAIIMMCVATSLLVVLLINIISVPAYGTIIAIIFFLFCFSGVYLCFSHRITINQKKGTIIFANFRKKEIAVKNVKQIVVNETNSINPKKYCFIDCILNDDTLIRISGYCNLGYRNATQKTMDIVNQVNELLQNLKE